MVVVQREPQRLKLVDAGAQSVATLDPARDQWASLRRRQASVETVNSLDGVLAMVVDDSATIRELIAVNLELEGYVVETAADADECLAYVEGVGDGSRRRPDIFLLDVVMPGTNGVELTRRLKSDPRTADVPVLIVSASAQQRDFEVARAAKADGYLTKPFDPDELLSEVAQLLQQ